MDAEVAAIVKFIGKKWSQISDLNELVIRIKEKALFDGRSMFNEGKFAEQMIALSDQRLKMLEDTLEDPEEKSLALIYDNVISLLGQFRRTAGVMYKASLTLDVDVDNKSFEYFTRPIEKNLKREFPSFAKSLPIGWADFKKDYTDYKGQDDYRPYRDRNLFEGVDPKGRGWHLVEKLALPYLMYDDVCQGRSPTYMLVSSIYTHFIDIISHINTQKLIKSAEKILPLDTPGVLFDIKFSEKTENPHLNILIGMLEKTPTREEFESSLKNKRDFLALSDEEKAERKAKNAERTREMFSRILGNKDSSSRDDKEKTDILKMKILMRGNFSGLDPFSKSFQSIASESAIEPK